MQFSLIGPDLDHLYVGLSARFIVEFIYSSCGGMFYDPPRDQSRDYSMNKRLHLVLAHLQNPCHCFSENKMRLSDHKFTDLSRLWISMHFKNRVAILIIGCMFESKADKFMNAWQ